MPASRSSTYSVPLTTVPAGADGVMVTFTVADAPGAMVMPSKANVPFIAPAQKSATGGGTAGAVAFGGAVRRGPALPEPGGPGYRAPPARRGRTPPPAAPRA